MGTTGIDRAPGVPSWSGSYTPELFNGKFLVEYYTRSVVPAISNTDYEGTLKKMGDKLTVPILPDITSRDYVKGQDLIEDQIVPQERIFYINRAKYFQYALSDVDTTQTHIGGLESALAAHAAKMMATTVDKQVLETIIAEAHASNVGATAGKVSGSYALGVDGTHINVNAENVIDKIVDAGAVLDEQEVPNDGRSIVIPAWMAAKLKTSDLKDASMTGDGASVLRNGRIGMIDRFTVYQSNNVSKDVSGDYYCIFCHRDALSFATQIQMNEKVRNQKDFGDKYRALMVYGFKVMKPEGLGVLVVKPTA
jgi:hypothetical protein